MIKNIIFDFGKVLVDFDPEYMTSRYISDEQDIKLVSEVLFDRLYWDKLDAGTISDEEVVSESCKRLPEKLHKAVSDVYYNWMYNLPEISGMRELLQKIREKGIRLFLLSNISKGFAKKSSEISVLSYFEKCYFSAICGCTKPSAEIFNLVLSENDIKAEETLFVDDSIKNTNGAEKVGIIPYLFDGDSKKLESYLKEISVL